MRLKLSHRLLWLYIRIDLWLYHKATEIEDYFKRRSYV